MAIAIIGTPEIVWGDDWNPLILTFSGIQVGDLKVVAMGTAGVGGESPDIDQYGEGWTDIRTCYQLFNPPDTYLILKLYVKIHEEGDSSTITLNTPVEETFLYGFRLSGVEQTIVDATPTVAANATGYPDCPAITTQTDGALIIGFGLSLSIDIPDAPANYTAGNGRMGNYMAANFIWRTLATAGAENPGAWTTWGPGEDYDWCAITAAIRPAGAASPVGSNMMMLF